MAPAVPRPLVGPVWGKPTTDNTGTTETVNKFIIPLVYANQYIIISFIIYPFTYVFRVVIAVNCAGTYYASSYMSSSDCLAL